MNVAVVIIAAVAVVGIAFLVGAVKIVRPFQRGLVERLGRYKATKDPGFNLILPFIETMQLVDMREQVVDVPPQEVITSDNVVVSVDAVVYYEATDPQRLIYNVADFFTAITKLAQTNLRNLIGDLELDKALTSRDTINLQLREVLDDATDKWGVKVVRVEIQRIDPPPEVVSAMHAQMRAERDRRATVTEARGFQEAAIARADGEKQSSILAAEGRKQAAVLDAEGDARAIELRAAAERLRLEAIGQGEGEAARARLAGIKAADADNNVLLVEYLTALERIGDGRATKLVIPAEFSGLLGMIAAVADTARRDDDADEVRPREGLPIPAEAERVDVPPPRWSRRVKLADAPSAGWYPDPRGGARLRWWDGSDWTDHYRAPPSSAERAIRSRRAVPPIPSAQGSHPLDRMATEQIIAEVRQAARSEIDRAADVFSQRARAAVREVQPLVTQYTNRALRWVRIAAVLAIALGIAWFTFQAVAQMSFFDWLGDRIDNLSD